MESTDPPPVLLQAFPPAMIGPWRTDRAEIRAIDIEQKTFAELKTYIDKHTGRSKRFYDLRIVETLPAKLGMRSKSDIATYLNNYIMNNGSYAEDNRNCQTFAADIYRLLTGKNDTVPYHPVCQVFYKEHVDWMLYEK